MIEMPRAICPFCDQPIRLNAWRRHVHACSRRPAADDLEELWLELGNVMRVAAAIGVTERLTRLWLHEAGVDTRRPLGHWSNPPRPPLAGPEFAPQYGRKKAGCDGCPEHFECRRRMRADLWPLCCIPSQHEVAWAYRDGRIGFDGRLPEWLPQVLEAIA